MFLYFLSLFNFLHNKTFIMSSLSLIPSHLDPFSGQNDPYRLAISARATYLCNILKCLKCVQISKHRKGRIWILHTWSVGSTIFDFSLSETFRSNGFILNGVTLLYNSNFLFSCWMPVQFHVMLSVVPLKSGGYINIHYIHAPPPLLLKMVVDSSYSTSRLC